MKHLRVSLVVILSIFLVGSLFLFNGCKKKEPEVIKIGAILPLTGSASLLGEYVKNGIDIAVEELNSMGGIKGKKIKVVFGDSKNDPKEGVAIFNNLLAIEKLPVVISAMTGVTQAIIPIADKNKVVLFATTVSASGITEKSPWTFRLFVTADIDAKTMANFASDKLKFKRVGILHVNDDFGLSFSKIFTSTFEEKGGKVIFTDGFDKGTTDYRGMLTKVKSNLPDAIYILGYDNHLGLLPKQMHELKINIPILSIGTIAQPNIMAQAGSALDGTYFTATEFSADTPQTPEAKLFIEKYKTKYGKDPNYFSAFAYDVIMITTDAIKNKGYSSDGIREGLLDIKGFRGVTGVILIKSNRDADFKMVVKTIKDGKVKDVK